MQLKVSLEFMPLIIAGTFNPLSKWVENQPFRLLIAVGVFSSLWHRLPCRVLSGGCNQRLGVVEPPLLLVYDLSIVIARVHALILLSDG